MMKLICLALLAAVNAPVVMAAPRDCGLTQDWTHVPARELAETKEQLWLAGLLNHLRLHRGERPSGALTLDVRQIGRSFSEVRQGPAIARFFEILGENQADFELLTREVMIGDAPMTQRLEAVLEGVFGPFNGISRPELVRDARLALGSCLHGVFDQAEFDRVNPDEIALVWISKPSAPRPLVVLFSQGAEMDGTPTPNASAAIAVGYRPKSDKGISKPTPVERNPQPRGGYRRPRPPRGHGG